MKNKKLSLYFIILNLCSTRLLVNSVNAGILPFALAISIIFRVVEPSRNEILNHQNAKRQIK